MKRRVLPGFRLSLGITLVYAAIIILLPLAATAYTQDFDFADRGESWFLNWMTPAEVTSWEAANGI